MHYIYKPCKPSGSCVAVPYHHYIYHKVLHLLYIIMIIITYSIDKSVENTFVINSLHLPISIARIHDEEEVSNTIDSFTSVYLYLIPHLSYPHTSSNLHPYIEIESSTA